jgi:hypothetical protein
MAIAAKKYNFDLIEFDYRTSLEQAALQTLETYRNADYQNILLIVYSWFNPSKPLKPQRPFTTRCMIP